MTPCRIAIWQGRFIPCRFLSLEECMKLFYTAQEKIPDGYGFSLFHGIHFFILLCILGMTWIFAVWYQKSRRKKQWRWGIVITMLLLEVVKDAVLLETGQFLLRYLPFDLCGLSIFFCLAYAWKPNLYWGTLLYSLSLPGTVLALLFPNWNRLPVWNLFCMIGFILHGLLLVFPVMLLRAGELRPKIKQLPMGFFTLVICSVIVYGFNCLWGTNFFFLSKPSKNSPLIWFANWFGDSYYWIGFPVLMLLIWSMLYGIPKLYCLLKQNICDKKG